MSDLRARAQLVFQDPYSALNPKLTVGSALQEVLRHIGKSPGEAKRGAEQLLEEVGLKAADAAKYPGGFSGGQRQRIVIARALAMAPEFLVLDESVAALDVQIQRDILDLLDRIGRERALTYLFISHDLDVVASFCDRLVILQKGRIVEQGETPEIMQSPRTAYTAELLASRPTNLR
jgi:peptide/nickel transport system ATP-binding protein